MNSCIKICLGEDLLIEIWGWLINFISWMSQSNLRFEKLLVGISLNTFSILFSLSSPSGTPVVQKLFVLIVSCKTYRLSSFLFIFFFFLLLWVVNFILSIFELIDSFICLVKPAAEALYWIPQLGHYILQLQNLFGSFSGFLYLLHFIFVVFC